MRSDPPTEVDVWSRPIDATASIDDDLDVLDDAELARASRYRFDRDRRAFVQRRASLRRILAGYVGGSPEAIRLTATATGKPMLADRAEPHFTLSHTDGLAVIAVSEAGPVGIDIERIRPIDDAIDLGRGLFAAAESAWVASAPPPERTSRFLTLWTRKESYVKALGTGLSTPLDRFEVWQSDGLGSGRPTGPAGTLPFAFARLDGLRGVIGAITAAGSRLSVRVHPA